MFEIKVHGKTERVSKEAFWHTSSHVLAQAVKRLFPDAKLGIGPAIKTGFYYDFKVDRPFNEEDIKNIENEMGNIIKEKLDVVHMEIPREELEEYLNKNGEIFKLELLKDIEGDKISVYKQGDFMDMCKGPHISNVEYIKAFKLTTTSAAYWRGDENRDVMQRIYGISFPKKSMLDEHLLMLEEAKKRDHRKLGKELRIFELLPEGPGFPFYLPNGMKIKNALFGFLRKLLDEYGYEEIETPIMLNQELWHRSGHWDHYRENMFTTEIEGKAYAVKPMNCPGGLLVYNTKQWSYRELPVRLSEFGKVHRYEKSGELNGLLRVSAFTQDDAHVICTREQVEEEIDQILEIVEKTYSTFGFDYSVELSTRPDDSMGSDEDWEVSTNALKNALDNKGIEYEINEGDGAFYGPKIDLHLIDALGRPWQCGTIQLDFQMPENFDIVYIGEDGEKHRPVMIHRAILGSLERFLAQIIEQFAGAFPTWIAPNQVSIIAVGEDQKEYVKKLEKAFKTAGIRTTIDIRDEKLGYKIREAQLQKIPYMLIIGKTEEENKEISVRSRDLGDLGKYKLEDFIKVIKEEIETYSLSSKFEK